MVSDRPSQIIENTFDRHLYAAVWGRFFIACQNSFGAQIKSKRKECKEIKQFNVEHSGWSCGYVNEYAPHNIKHVFSKTSYIYEYMKAFSCLINNCFFRVMSKANGKLYEYAIRVVFYVRV